MRGELRGERREDELGEVAAGAFVFVFLFLADTAEFRIGYAIGTDRLLSSWWLRDLCELSSRHRR